eukprot:TRINITY_DN16874_c0_g1_i1.p1 TRINITY_DN16874_c0_g1~~TRINITY_DN16874_c0_g1_i1.p1  ORF type:complete len:156 (-),score=31.29 TRINITY_DN16874_c0_g1_i1:64-531(-)
MSYDQGGAQHSPMALAQSTVTQITQAGLPMARTCLGLPFYGRAASNGDWTSYEDLVQRHHPLDADLDQIKGVGFNGAYTIAQKTRLAVQAGMGGVMIWEVGQDCRLEAVTHGAKTHPVTCPAGQHSSLLVAVTRAMADAGVQLAGRAAAADKHEL